VYDNNLDKVWGEFLIMSKISSNFKSFNISFSTDINKKASNQSLDSGARRQFLMIFNLLKLTWDTNKVSIYSMAAYKLE